MRSWIASVAVACVSALAATAGAQTISVSETPFRPYPDGSAARGVTDPTPFSRVYVNVIPSAIASGTTTPEGTALPNVKGDTYLALDFVFSVASRLLVGDTAATQRAEISALSELKRLNAHVVIEGVTAKPGAVAGTPPSVLALMITPSEPTLGSTSQSSITSAANAALSLVPILGKAESVMQSFLNARPQRSTPDAFAYQSGHGELGWVWSSGPSTTAEGIHRCSVLLQANSTITSLRVSVDLASDWSRYGAWVKRYEFSIPLPLTSQ